VTTLDLVLWLSFACVCFAWRTIFGDYLHNEKGFGLKPVFHRDFGLRFVGVYAASWAFSTRFQITLGVGRLSFVSSCV